MFSFSKINSDPEVFQLSAHIPNNPQYFWQILHIDLVITKVDFLVSAHTDHAIKFGTLFCLCTAEIPSSAKIPARVHSFFAIYQGLCNMRSEPDSCFAVPLALYLHCSMPLLSIGDIYHGLFPSELSQELSLHSMRLTQFSFLSDMFWMRAAVD